MSRFVSLLCLTGCFVVLSPGFSAAQTCAVASCHRSIIESQYPHSPVKEKDCFACHNQKNTTHPLLGAKSWELTAKVPVLCEQCHNPFGKKKVLHPPVKDGDCLACHKPHGGAGRFLLNVNEDQTDLCTGCHDSAPFKRKFTHGPVAVGSCTKCHDPHEAAEKSLLSSPVWEVCLKCHDDFKAQMKGKFFIHAPVKNGPCTSCHDPHGSQNAKLLKNKTPDLCMGCHKEMEKKLKSKIVHKPLTQEGGCTSCHDVHFSNGKKLLSSSGSNLCLSCHGTDKLGTPPLNNIKKEIEGKKFLHGPVSRGECQACHDPHGNDNFRMLKGSYPADLYVPYKEKIYDACLLCHEKNLLRFADTTIYTGFRNGKRNLHYVHVVNSRKGRTCRVCHEPHASNGEKLINKESVKFGEWKIPINFKISASGGSCAPGCHRAYKYDRDKPQVY
ncbi:MAG: cytochrome C [Desulfobulbaceae bacterium]|nr:cytochrome C [Desulfobulbaceae bacterium]